MLDSETPADDDKGRELIRPTVSSWTPPDLDPSKALPPYTGYRASGYGSAHPRTEAHRASQNVSPSSAIEPRRRSRLAGCLWAGITAVVIFSLLGTSLLAYFVVQRDVAQSQNQLQAAEVVRSEASAMLLSDSNAPVSDTNAPPLPTAAAVAAGQSEPVPPVDLTLNQLVLVNGRGQLETIEPDGSDRQALTQLSDGTIFGFPTWSPDGRSVAAIGTSVEGGGIFIFNNLAAISSPEETRRYFSDDQAPVYLYWSPDSQRVAFLANHSRNAFGLNIMPGDGGVESRVVATGSPLYWNWAEDSEVLLLHSGDTGPEARLVAIDSNGDEQTPNLARPGQFQAPGISPGGRYWSYAEEEGRGVSTLVVAHTGTGERRLIQQAGSLAMTWSPTDEQLAYTSGSVDAHPFWGPLRVVDAETGDTRLLTTDTVLAFFWSPDGRQIAYLTVNGSGRDDVYASSNVRLQRVNRLSQPIQQGGSGFLALSVVDVASGQGLRLMNFQPTATFATQFLPFFAQYSLSHRIWSPDSTAIVLPVHDDADDLIMVIPANGASPRPVAEGNIAFWSHH